jgi:hypothetical protein
MNPVVELLRKWNRARLERRHQRKASGEIPRAWLPRLVYRLRAKNHARLAERRVRKQVLASLAANDTAVLEALVFILRTSRQDQRARAEADEAMAKRLGAIEARLDAGLRLLSGRLDGLDARLAATPAAAARARAEPAVNGARQNGPSRAELEPVAAPAPGEGERTAVATAPKRERL